MSTIASPRSSPTIIIGASRSGTGLLVRVLAANGWFTGNDLTPNDESWFFQRLNRWMFSAASAGLERPMRLSALVDDLFVRRSTVAVLRAEVATWSGPTTGPWVFKDPRTTFTLPLWLDLFPEATVIHMLRHGVDVAASLVDRRRRVEERWAVEDDGAPVGHRRLLDEQRMIANLDACTLDDAFAQWRVYARQASRARATTVRYEALVQSPDATCAQLSAAIGACVDAEQARRQGVTFKAERAFAHRAQPHLCAFASRRTLALADHAYAAPVPSPQS